MLIHEALWMLGTKVFRKRLNVNFTPHFSSFFPLSLRSHETVHGYTSGQRSLQTASTVS